MPPTLHLQLFGGFCLSYNGQPLAELSRRSQSLLTYLVLHRHAPQPRLRLAGQLWPDSTDAQARTNLRKELSHLRRLLPVEQCLRVETKTLYWCPQIPVMLDVERFEQLLKMGPAEACQADLEEAIALYRGPLLPDGEDDWLCPERDRLQQLYIRTLGQLVDRLEQQSSYDLALDYTQRWLHQDPLNEAIYGRLMRLHYQKGDRAQALALYHRCMTLLRDELGIDPSASIRHLYEQYLQDGDRPDASVNAGADTITARETEGRPNERDPLNHRPLGRDLGGDPQRLAAPLAALTVSARTTEPGWHKACSLVGRDRERQQIRQWIDPLLDRSMGARDRGAEVLLLVGELGIGKTCLLEDLCAQQRQIAVVWGRGFAAEQMRPYGMWIDALRSHPLPPGVSIPQDLGFLLPELTATTPTLPDRTHLFDAMVQFLRDWSQHQPLLLVFDDLHWMDEASSSLLHYVVRLLSDRPVQVAATARHSELEENLAVSKVLQALRRDHRLQTLMVGPLNRAQTLDLIHQTPLVADGDRSIELADRVFIDSGGNPLFALEVLYALARNHHASTETLDALIGDRLQQLDPSARDLLPWAATLGRTFQPTTLATIMGYPLPKLLLSIEQLEYQHIIRPSQSGVDLGYDFAHDIVRQVVYRQLSAPRRRLMHLQIAHTLRDQTNQGLAGEIAHHASLGGDALLAATASLTAAEEGLKLFAYAEALELAQRGIHHCQTLDDRTRIRLHLQLLRVCVIAGVRRQSVAEIDHTTQRLIQEAIALGLKDEEAIGIETLVVLHFNHHNFSQVHQHSLRATEVSRAASPATAARLLAYGGACLAEIGREMCRAEALLLEAQALAERVDLELIDVLSGLGMVYRHNGAYENARLLFHRHWQMAQSEQDHWQEVLALSYLIMTELDAGNPAAALPYCHELMRVAEQIKGDGSEGATAAALLALTRYQLREAGAEMALAEAIATLQQVDNKRMLSYVLIGAAMVDLSSDRPELAATRAELAQRTAYTLNHPSEMTLASALGIQSALACGDRSRVAADWTALLQQCDRPNLSALACTLLDQVQAEIECWAMGT